jgi:hypothetical protein
MTAARLPCSSQFLRQWLWLVCAVLVALTPFSVQADEQKFERGFYEASRSATQAKLKRIGILPANVSREFAQADAVRPQLEAMVAERLARIGIEVIGPDRYEATFADMEKRIGGRYDSLTGEFLAERHKAAHDHAERDFIESERLDGTVFIRVFATKAALIGSELYWDRVTEPARGRRASNAFAEFWTAPSGSSGRVGALSLLVAVHDTNDKLLYADAGGIQPLVYYDPAYGRVDSFLSVPFDQALRDTLRLERAVDLAVESWVKSQEELHAEQKRLKELKRAGKAPPKVELPPLPAGVEDKPSDPLKLPRDEILARVKSVVIAPLSAAGFEVSNEKRAQYQKLLADELSRAGIAVTIDNSLRDAMLSESKRVGGFWDPITGTFDEARAKAARDGMLAALPADKRPDAVLWAGLESRQAAHNMGDASWDGTSQSAVTLGPVKKTGFWLGGGTANIYAGQGGVPAVSLRVTLRAADDTILYAAYGGIQLTKRMQGTEFVTLLPSEFLQKPENDAAAAHIALRNLVLTPEQLEAEINPPKKSAKRKN